MDQLANIVNGDDIKLLEMALRMPDTLKTDKDDIDEEEYKSIIEAMNEALSKIVEFRNEEGKVLEEVLSIVLV